MSNQIPDGLKRTILQEANDLIHNDRRQEYGAVTPSFENIAKLASIFIGKELTKFDICWIMIALKISRQQSKPKRDNLVDLAGYTGLMQQLLDEAEHVVFPKASDPFNIKPKQPVFESFDVAFARYMKERELTQPQTGVCNDYRQNAQAQGWVKAEKKNADN